MSTDLNINNQSSSENVLPSETIVPSESVLPSTPVLNIWQKRTEEASKLKKIVSQENDNHPRSDGKSGEGYHQLSDGKGGKGYHPKSDGKGGKGYHPRSDGKGGKGYHPRSDGKGGKGSRPRVDDENNLQTDSVKVPYVKREYKELSPEEKSLRDEKTKAFNLAQDHALKLCVDRCNPKVREDINNSISYEVDYRRTLVMDTTEDEIVVEVNENKHVYSLKRFLENRYFENKLRDEYSTILPAAWVRLFPGRDEGTFCISIQKRKV
jgi:hypothetical protein